MSVLSVQPPFPIFTDIDGQPLEDGFIYIGTANQPPFSNPITVYWDAALTIPAVQPIRTRGGYPVNSGTPARLYVNSDYSIQVQNKNGSVVYSAPVATERYNAAVITDVSFIQAGVGAVPRTMQNKVRERVSVLDFGATGDGVTDDAVAIQLAINSVAPSFDVGYGAEVFFPKAINNGNNSYLIGSTIEVPPGVILVGEGIGNANNKSGSAIQLNFDGVGIRFVRRNPAASLFHNGGMRDIAVQGTGGSSTTAQRLVELGDSTQVNVQNGAWNGCIRDCLFNNTRGFGIYSAHSQEWLIEHNMFRECNRAINYSTVPASSRVENNSFINESATPCDYAVNYEPGSLGGATGFICRGNYSIGFKRPIYIAGCQGVIVHDNVIEGAKETAITMSTTTFTGTSLGTGQAVLPMCNIQGNQLIACGADGLATYGIVFDNTRFCTFIGNYNTSPFATLAAVLHLSESAPGLTSGNFIYLPTHTGNNSGTVPIYDQNNGLWDAQTIQDQFFLKLRDNSSLPILGPTGDGAIAIRNGDLHTRKANQNWYRVAVTSETILAPNVTSADASGASSIINQNDAVTTLSALSNGVNGQCVTIHSANANTTVSVDGTPLVVPQYQCATYQYSGFYAAWRFISKSF